MAIIYLEAGGIGALDTFTNVGGATKMDAVDGRPSEDDAKYIERTGAGNFQHFTVTQYTGIVKVNSNPRLRARARVFYTDIAITETIRGGLYLGASRTPVNLATYTDASAGPGPWVDTDQEIARPGGGLWVPDDLKTVELYAEAPTNATSSILHCSTLYAYVDVTLSEKGYAAYASRVLRMRRRAPGLMEIRIPSLEFLDHELLDLMAISHPGLPSASGRGAGVKGWERWPVVKLASEPIWETGEEVCLVMELRDYLCRIWDVAKSLKATSDLTEGIPRLDGGNTRTWSRGSSAWVYRADGMIAPVGSDSDKHDANGDLFEGESANEIIQSAFKNGAANVYTGWTQSGTGSNGSAIADDTADLLFDTTVASRSVKLTAGTPIHAADLQLQATATASFLANTILRASIWHRDDSGYAAYWAAQRSVDSRWWRDSDQTWQVAKTWNALAVSTSRARGKSKQIDVGAGATTVTVFVGIPTTGQAGQVNHVFHVQLEQKRFVTSTIATETVKYTRAADKLTWSNNSACRAWIAQHATFRGRVRPWWDAADVATVNKTIFYVGHDANNYDWLYFDGPNARLVYERKAAGVTYRAVKAWSPAAETEYKVAARCTGSNAELDLTAYTLSVFIDGVKGTDVVAAALVELGTSDVEVGSKAAAEHLDGNLWGYEFIQYCLNDGAVARY